MSAVRDVDILLRSGGAEVLRTGVPWLRRRVDGREIEAPTFTRADATTCATFVDKDGAIRTAAAGKLRLSWADTDSDGVWETPGLLLESQRTNLCLQSENFGTTWTTIGTPTRSAGAATCGVVSLDLIGDDDAGAIEGYRQTGIVISGTSAALSFVFKWGPSPPPTGIEVQLYDTTAGATRLGAIVLYGATPNPNAATGTFLGMERLAGGCYRVHFQSATITSGNTHRVDVFPGSQSGGPVGDVGNTYIGAVQLEAAPYPTSYIKTTTAAVTRAADRLLFPSAIPFETVTAYIKMARPVWAAASGTITAPYIMSLGTSLPRLELYGVPGSRSYEADSVDGAATASSVALAIPAGATQEMRATFAPTLSATLDVGSGATTDTDTPTGAVDVFPGNVLALGDAAHSAGSCGNVLLNRFLLLRGSFTLAECQAVSW